MVVMVEVVRVVVVGMGGDNDGGGGCICYSGDCRGGGVDDGRG